MGREDIVSIQSNLWYPEAKREGAFFLGGGGGNLPSAEYSSMKFGVVGVVLMTEMVKQRKMSSNGDRTD